MGILKRKRDVEGGGGGEKEVWKDGEGQTCTFFLKEKAASLFS